MNVATQVIVPAAALLRGAGGVDAFVSLTLLRDPRVLLPGIACGLMMWLSAAAVVALARRARPEGAPGVERFSAAE